MIIRQWLSMSGLTARKVTSIAIDATTTKIAGKIVARIEAVCCLESGIRFVRV